MSKKNVENEQIADILDQIAHLLETKQANRFRIRAYGEAAEIVRSSGKPVAHMVQEGGDDKLKELPGVGEGISSVIEEYVKSGRSEMLEELQAEVAPEDLYTQVPGIGEGLAGQIVEKLDISSLEELEQAAHDGRLEEVEGFGPTKVRNVQVSLAGMLSAAAQRERRRGGEEEPPQRKPGVERLLDVDAEYRQKAEADQLRKIAPKRFNPEGEAWLPILNTRRNGWKFTALYSNTKRAHDLGKTNDWVVLYYEWNGEEGQATVVTETQGALQGERVVRGRERECQEYYQGQD